MLNFPTLLDNGSSLYMLMKSFISPDLSDAKRSWQIKQEADCVGNVVSLNEPVCFVFCNIRGSRN